MKWRSKISAWKVQTRLPIMLALLPKSGRLSPPPLFSNQYSHKVAQVHWPFCNKRNPSASFYPHPMQATIHSPNISYKNWTVIKCWPSINQVYFLFLLSKLLIIVILKASHYDIQCRNQQGASLKSDSPPSEIVEFNYALIKLIQKKSHQSWPFNCGDVTRRRARARNYLKRIRVRVRPPGPLDLPSCTCTCS